MAATSWESLKNLHIPDKKEFVESGVDMSEKIIGKVVEAVRDVEQDCRIKADELFSFFTADIIKKTVIFYK